MVRIDDKMKHATKATTHWIGISGWPNKSPEPTAIAAVSGFEKIWVCIDFGARWLSFFR